MLSLPVTDQDHYRGNPDAHDVIVQYVSYECPDCLAAREPLEELIAQYPDNLMWVVRNLPLDQLYPIQPNATEAAGVAEAAAVQGKFWEMHDALYDNQDRLGDDTYEELAMSLGMNIEQFEEDRVSAEVTELVISQVAAAQADGVTATPGLFFNGELHKKSEGVEVFVDMVHAAMKARGIEPINE
jgi:protein-disulfide isomerase